MIDNIEMNIFQSKDYVLQGEKDIIKAKKYMISARKVFQKYYNKL
jgi:hypothetical protein